MIKISVKNSEDQVIQVSTLHSKVQMKPINMAMLGISKYPNVTVNGDSTIKPRVDALESGLGDLDYDFEQHIDTNLTF